MSEQHQSQSTTPSGDTTPKGRRTLVALAALLVLAILAGVAAFVALPRRPEVSLTTLGRLRRGMSEAEVAAVLGPPTADLTAHPPAGLPPPPAGGKLLEYSGKLATAQVEFDAAGGFARSHAVIHTVTGLERLRIRLNWW
jgi:hypothetical protein